MDILEDLQERLNETERRATEVVQRLEKFDALQHSLANAGRGLGEANAIVSDLVSVARDAIESLNSALSAFQNAVELLQRTEPLQVDERLLAIEEALARITEKLGVVDELSSDIRNTRKAVERLSRRSIFHKIFGRNAET